MVSYFKTDRRTGTVQRCVVVARLAGRDRESRHGNRTMRVGRLTHGTVAFQCRFYELGRPRVPVG